MNDIESPRPILSTIIADGISPGISTTWSFRKTFYLVIASDDTWSENVFPKYNTHTKSVVRISFDEKSITNDEKPDPKSRFIFLVDESRGVYSDAEDSSSSPIVLSDTSIPGGSFDWFSRAIFSRISCASIIQPFMHWYLGDSGTRE
ncbi:hypothetical protein D5086_032599 [Populus alba]|uniref:Uncharacterized protein n=1 Tax=Populus alba TaxID=43335 RepID=A0ACC4AMH5_POPAL